MPGIPRNPGRRSYTGFVSESEQRQMYRKKLVEQELFISLSSGRVVDVRKDEGDTWRTSTISTQEVDERDT